MADELEAIFADDTPDSPEPQDTPEVVMEEAEAIAPEPIPEPEPQPQPEPVAPRPERPDPGFVPIATMMEERDKRRALEAEIAKYRQQQAPEAPDPYDDPNGFAAHQQQLIEQRMTQQRFELGDMFARQTHGAEVVDQAIAWAQERANADPAFVAGYMRQQNPVDWIVQQHKREALLSDIGGNVDDWFEREAAKRGYAKPSAPVAAAAPVAAPIQQAVPPVKVPRSLATQGSGPSDIRDVATGALAAVDAVFPG